MFLARVYCSFTILSTSSSISLAVVSEYGRWKDVEKIFGKRPWMSRSQEIMEDEQPKIDDTVKELPEVQAAIKEHEENNKNAEDKQDDSRAEDKQDDNN